MRLTRHVSGAIGLFLAFQALADAPQTPAAKPAAGAPTVAPEPLFAMVNGTPITIKDFHSAYANYLRQKFYHGQVPEGQLLQARKEVADRLIERILLLNDAKVRGLTVDQQKINLLIAEYDARYAVSQMWQQNRESLLPGLKQQLADQQLLEQMEAIGRTIAVPTQDEVKAFFTARPELFTEPEKMHLHTILLKVDPGAPKALWDAAREEAKRIVAKLRGGASFSELARLHSLDVSAEKGGDMGYLHKGMIPDEVQTQIDAFPMGSVTDPIDVLEGIAVFRLDERVPSKLASFESVAKRADDLLRREQTGKAWDRFIANLRKTADIKQIEPLMPIVPGQESK